MEVGNVSFVAELDLSKAQAQLEEFRKQLNGIKVTSTSIGDFEKTIKKLNNQKITIKVNHNPLTGLNKHIDAKVAHVKKANTYFKNNPLKVETKIDELSYKELQSKVKALKEKGLTKIPLNAKKEVLRNELSKQSSVGNSGLNNCDCEGIKSELKAIRSILSVKLSKANNGITENAKNVRQLLATKSANPVSVTKQKESGLENTVKSLNQEIKQVIPEVISQLNSVIKTKQEPEKDTFQIEVLSRLSSIDNGIFHVFSSTEKLFGILKEQNKILEQKSEQKDEQKDSNINSEIKNGLSTINDSLVQILGTNKESNNALKSNNQIVTQIQTLLKQRHKEKEQLKSKTSKTQGMQPKEMPLGYQVALKAILGAFKGLDINEIEIPMLKPKAPNTTGQGAYDGKDNSISLKPEIYERISKGEATKKDLKILIHELVHAVTNNFERKTTLNDNLKEKIKPNTLLNIPLSESAKKQASTFSGRYVAGQVYPQKQIIKVEDEFLAEAVALTLQDKVFEVFEFLSGKSNAPATLTQETELVQIIQLLSDIYNALLKTTEAEIIPAKQSQVEKQKQLKRTSSISLSQSNSESLSLGREKKMTVEIDGEKIDLLKLNPKFVELVREFTSARSNPNLDFDAFSELSDRLVSLADDLNEWNDDGESLKHPYDYGILMEHIMEGSFVDQQGFDDNDEVSYSLDDTAIVDVINQSNTYLKGIRRTCDEIFDRLNKPLDVSETKGKTQATPQTKGMKPSEMPLGYQVALKAILSAFDLKIEDIAIPELVEMSKEDSKIAEGSYCVATNKIHLPKKDMDNLKNNNIDELLMKTLIHELVHAVINNFRTGWEEDDLQSTMVGDFIQPRVVNIPLKENAKQLSQGFLALYKDDPAYLEGSMIGKTGEYNAEVVAMSLMLEAYALYEQMLDNPNYLGKDKNKFDSFAVKESYEVKVVKLLENIFNLLKAKFGIETKTEDKPKTTRGRKPKTSTSSNETQPEDKPKTTRGRKPKSSTSPEVLPSLLDTDSLSLSLDDDTGTEELLKSPVLFYKEFMKRMPLIQKEFEKIDIKNLKKTIQKLPVELKEELQDNLDDVKLSFNNLSSVEKNFKYIEKAFNNYEKSKNKNKKALKGFLGYSEIEAELKKVYAQLEQKQELDIDLDIEKEPLWETIQLLESLLEKSESLADITIDFPSMDAFIKDSGWIDWLSDADLSKIDEELVESFSGYAKGIIGEWETIIPALDHIFKEITALSEEEGYEIQKNLSAGSPGLITDILDIWQRRGLSGLGEIFDRITVSAQESSNEMQNALGGFLEYFDFDIKRFAFDKITDGLREITVGAFNSALQVENLARQLTFSTGKSGATELQRIKRESQDLGINFIEAAEGYRQFSASTLGTSMNAMSGELVSKFQKSFAAYGLNREQQQGAFLALSQMASKGVVSMEELRQQLSERLPGAMNAAASSMGMAVPEFNKLVESGQVLAEDLLPKMADQLEQDTGIALMQTVKSTQSELTRLENNIFNIQAGLGQLQLTLAKLGLPILNAMLKTLVDNMDWIAIVIGSLAISIGVKLVGSILLTNIAIIKSIGLINALSLAFGTLWASLGPILPLALIISGIAVAVKGLHGTITAHTKEIKEYNNALKELAIIEAKIRKDEKPKKDGKRYDRTTKDFWNENSWDASVDFITQRSTRQANEFINDSKMANEALQSVTDSIINASKRTRDIDIGNGVTVGNDLSEDTITKVQDRLTDLRTQSANLKFKIAVLADKGDLEKVKELQEELGKVNKEIGRVSTEPFAEVAVMEKRLKAVQALAEQFEMKKTEMELKGLDSRASQYNMWLEEARKLEAEINEQIEKRNEAIKEANDLYTKRIQTLRQLQRELAKINYMTQLEGIDNQITAIQRRTGGETSEYQFDQEMRQARAIEVETKLKLSTEAFNIYENDVKSMLSNLDADLKTQIATEIGVADLDKALMEKKVSPEAFAQLTGDMVSQEIKDLVEQSPDLKELIVKSQDYLTTWQDIKQQQLESANVVKEQFDATKQRKSDLRDFKRQLEDLDLQIADYFRQRARGLEDFETQYQDIAIQNQRQSRDLLEQYQDLGRTLNLQLLQAKNQLATLEKDIKRQSLTNQARQSLNFGADGLFSGFINLIDELMVSENEFDAQELTLNEQRLQTEEEVVNIARQIRSLQEQSYDAERQRIVQLRDLMRAQEDWIIQQKSSWLSITRQVEDMERQAKEMGIAFTGIAEHLDGINGSYLKIHNAIADMAEQIQNSANNMSVGASGKSGTPTGNVVTPVAGLNMNSNYQWGASRDYGTHWKVDYPMPNGTPVVSSIDGEITKLAYDKAGEAHIIVKNGDTEIILGHLRDVTVKLGDMVSAGQQLGTSGDGHLDYGVKHKSQWIHPNEFHKNPEQYLGANYKANANTSSSSSSNTNTNNQNKGNNTQSLTQQNKPTTKQPEQDDLEMAKHLQKIRVARMAEARQELIDARKQLESAKTNLASAQKNRKNIEPYVFAQFQEEVKRVEQLVRQKHKNFTYWEDAAINGQKEIEVILNRRNLINKLNSEPDKKPVKPITDNQQQSKLQEEYNQLRKLEKPTPAQIKRRLELEKILKNNSLSSLPLNFSTPELNNFELNASLNPIIEPKKIEDQLGQMNFNLPIGLESTGFKDNLNFDVNKSIEVAQTIKLRDLMLEVGFPKDKISDFIGIFGAESTFNPNAHNYSDLTKDDSYGLGQVNLYGPLKARLQQFGLSRPEELYDIRTNLEAVLAIYHEAGNSFAPWAGTHGKGLHTKFMNADPTVNLANNTVNGVGSTVSTSGGNFNVPQIPRLPENTGNLSIGRKQLNEIITGFNPKGISDGIAPLTVTMDNSSVKLITDSLGRVIINSQNVDPIIATLKNNQQVTQEQMMNILYFKDQNDYPGLMNYLEQQNIDLAKHKDEILQRTREQYEQQRQAEQLENEKKAVESTRQALQAMRQQQEAVRSLQLQMMQFNETIYGYLTASEKANIIEKERENQFLSLIDQITNAREEIEKFVDFSQDPVKGKEALNNLLNKFKAMGNDVNTPELKAQIEEYLKAIDAGMSPLLASVEIVRLLQKELNNTEDAFKDTTERMKQFTKETSLLTDALSALQPLVDVFDKIDATVAIGLRKDIALMEIDKQFVEIEQALRNNVESLQRELEKTDLTEDERKFVEEQLKRSQDAINKLTPELKIKIKAKTILDTDFQNIADQISAVLDIRKKVAERAEKDNPFEGARYQAEIRELEIIIDLQNQLKAIEDARIKFQNNPEILSKLDEYEKRVKQFADVDLSRIEQEVNVFAKAIKDPLNNAFKGLFSDFIRGTKTLKDLFLDFANSVADFFADLAAKMATQWVMDKLFPPKKEDDKNKKEGSTGWTWRAFEEVWGNYNGQGGNGNNNGITYSTLPLPKGFEIPQLQPMSTNIEDMTSNITYDILQSNPIGTMNINLPPQMQQGGSNILGGLFSGLLSGVAGGLSSGFSGLFTGSNPFSGGAGLAMPSSFVNPMGFLSYSNPLSLGTAGMITPFSQGGVVENASLGLSVMKAMKKEGVNAVPIVAHLGERLLSAKTGDAQIFNQMEKDGIWDEYKRNRFNPEVKSFNAGGIVGNGIKQFTRNYNNSNRVQNQSTIINVSTPDALSFRKSRSQLAQEEKLAQKRMERFK